MYMNYQVDELLDERAKLKEKISALEEVLENSIVSLKIESGRAEKLSEDIHYLRCAIGYLQNRT